MASSFNAEALSRTGDIRVAQSGSPVRPQRTMVQSETIMPPPTDRPVEATRNQNEEEEEWSVVSAGDEDHGAEGVRAREAEAYDGSDAVGKGDQGDRPGECEGDRCRVQQEKNE